MSRHANPALIGVFVLGALALGVTLVMLLAGGQWFQERHQHVMYFDEAAEGLQVGAPVVFLGVKVGTVKRIQLGLNEENRRFMVPVIIELEPLSVKTHAGENINLQDRSTIRDLVDRGLRARLKVQSLLTGQRYVDLDFHPDKAARFVETDPKQSEIPTIPTTVEELTTMLEGFPMDQFLANLAGISRSLNTLLASEAAIRIPQRLTAILTHLESLTARLNAEGGSLLSQVRGDLAELRQALTAVQTAMLKVGTASDQVGTAADRVGNLADPDSRMAASITRAGEEMAAAAQALQNLTDSQSPTVQHLSTAAQEISRAARALRLLAESLEQQPEALLQGKRAQEGQK